MDEVVEALREFGVDDWEGAWRTIKKVWASKFNQRAISSIKRLGFGPD